MSILKNILGYDGLIIVAAIVNFIVFWFCLMYTNKIYNHFNRKDHVSNLQQEQKLAIGKTTIKKDNTMTDEELLANREKMNCLYTWYTNITSIFPLMGMFGTVLSLLSMMDLIGTEATGAFFEALTSTFWGIIFAMIYKAVDSFISYKIDDNEKHMEYIFKPGK